jgi:hypothetical protein
MRHGSGFLLVLAALVVIVAPLALCVVGLVWHRGPRPAAGAAAWDWRLTISSTLLSALAYNLVFFVQELFLVLPKALTPGLHPTLFHNNHIWTGEHPLASLFQGTGALATLLLGLAALGWATRRPDRSTALRLFGIWVGFHGLFAALPQVVIGAVLPQNDVGMAMDYLGLGPVARGLAAIAALAAIVAAGAWLARPLLELAGDRARVDSAAGRMRFIGQIATVPAFAAILLILPFRIPGPVDQVAIVPVAVMVIGVGWIQASAWRTTAIQVLPRTGPMSLWPSLVALVAILLIFQLVLRPGIAF